MNRVFIHDSLFFPGFCSHHMHERIADFQCVDLIQRDGIDSFCVLLFYQIQFSR